MSFTDPQSVTVAGVANSLPRIAVDGPSSRYSTQDGGFVLSVSHSYGKRNRRTIRLTRNVISADPLFPSQNVPHSLSVYIVADVPKVGFTAQQQIDVVAGFLAYMTANSSVAVTKLVGGEN